MDLKGNVKTVHFNQLKKIRIRYNSLGYYVDHSASDGVMPESTKVDLDEIETDCVPVTENDAQNVNDPVNDGPYFEINEANVLPSGGGMVLVVYILPPCMNVIQGPLLRIE